MRSIIIALLLVFVLSAVVGSVAVADEGGMPNDNAYWGQAVSDIAPGGAVGDMSSHDHMGKKGCPPAWGAGGVPMNHP